ncbi:MAG: class I SAM-dependent methyltransferase [Zetaproteobacteria bacterium]|nr:class I SAM-dependent methyltransferase [Zetaproteobacteria bacterium]
MSRSKRKKTRHFVRQQPRKPIDLPPFDKYWHYMESVQAPEVDAEFFEKVYRRIHQLEPKVLQEDFCGTHAVCCEWVKRHESYRAVGVDIDPEPIQYGAEHYQSQLQQDQCDRIQIVEGDVLQHTHSVSADIVVALNFSYFCFKERSILKNYFTKTYERLAPRGLFFMDCFGGSKCSEPNEEETEHADLKFSYFWDQKQFDPINNASQFAIHFKRYGEDKREDVFTYNWRMWSIAELRDLLEEVGFKRVHVYWEMHDEDGDGNGEYEPVTQAEDCEAWVAYVIGEK